MTFEEVHEKLDKFVHYLAHNNANGAPLMDHDEICGELYLEMVKGFQHYGHLPEGQVLALLRKMFDNRIAELTYKYYGTHRKFAANAGSIGQMWDEQGDHYTKYITWTTAPDILSQDPSIVYEGLCRVNAVYESLSDKAKTVFCAVMGENPLLAEHIQLAGIRASFVYKGRGTVSVRPWQVADSLAMDESDVRSAFREIGKAYSEVVSNV